MEYIRLEISIPDAFQEIFISEFFDMDFSGFEQLGDRLIAYIPAKSFNDTDREMIQQWLQSQNGNIHIISETTEATRDYNEEWEKSIQPILVGDFFIRPTWSKEQIPVEAVLLEIDPKMAFGTGYHATTRLVLQNMPLYVGSGTRILDVGTGTGILSIAALKKGAGSALGFDIDEWSFNNAMENAVINGVAEHFEIRSGSFEVINEDEIFDLILANVNRNALLDMADNLTGHLKEGGVLMLSGLLSGEKEMILRNRKFGSLIQIGEDQEGEWIVMIFRK